MDSLQSIFLDLNQLVPIVNHWFHLLSAVIWIGGLAFLVMAVNLGCESPGYRKNMSARSLTPSTNTISVLPGFY